MTSRVFQLSDIPAKTRARFHARVDRSGGPEACHPWTGSVNEKGYGQIGFGVNGLRFVVSTHRLAWMLVNGDIPPGMSVCHKCDNPPCCNGADLFLGTPAENTADMVSKGRAATGEKHPNAVLSDATVLAMRDEYARGADFLETARRFGVDKTTARQAIVGERWSHLPNAQESRGQGRLTGADLAEMIRLRNDDGLSLSVLARMFGVDKAHVSRVTRGIVSPSGCRVAVQA